MRFYLLPESAAESVPAVGDTLHLEKDESHHLLRVMRAQPGTGLRLGDGRGRFFDAELVGGGRRAEVRITGIEEDAAEVASPRLVLVCAVVKGRRFEWALEKAVEVGVHEVRPLVSERSVVKPREGKTERWRGVLRAAAKQAGRCWLPRLFETAVLESVLRSLPGDAVVYFGDTSSLVAESGAGVVPPVAAELAAINPGTTPPGQLVFIVGPEGGWSEAECARLRETARPVCLGPHRLRTETAAVAGLVFLQAARGLYRGESAPAID